MRSARRILLSFLLPAECLLALAVHFAATGCAGGSKPATEPAPLAPASRPILQFAAVADSGEGGSATEHGNLLLEPPKDFGLKSVDIGRDQLGRPALQFEIVDLQREEFRRWTGTLVGRRLAVLVDGKVLTAPRVISALPGGGVVESGATPWTKEEVRALVERIRSQIGGAK
jgi:hypothetical protein